MEIERKKLEAERERLKAEKERLDVASVSTKPSQTAPRSPIVHRLAVTAYI